MMHTRIFGLMNHYRSLFNRPLQFNFNDNFNVNSVLDSLISGVVQFALRNLCKFDFNIPFCAIIFIMICDHFHLRSLNHVHLY